MFSLRCMQWSRFAGLPVCHHAVAGAAEAALDSRSIMYSVSRCRCSACDGSGASLGCRCTWEHTSSMTFSGEAHGINSHCQVRMI